MVISFKPGGKHTEVVMNNKNNTQKGPQHEAVKPTQHEAAKTAKPVHEVEKAAAKSTHEAAKTVAAKGEDMSKKA